MKLFLLILFAGFHHGSFAVDGYQLKHAKEYSLSCITNNAVEEHYEQDFFATLSPAFTYTKHYKNVPHHRQHNFAKDLYQVPSLRNDTAPINDNFFVARYSYCKPIGLFLIFPQHYFW